MLSPDFAVSTLVGDVYATEFTFVNTTSSSTDIRQVVWDFGDNSNLVYNVDTITHIYFAPGIYQVSLSVTNNIGETFSTTKIIEVDLAYRDYVHFREVPDTFADPGTFPKTPFKVEVLTTQITNPVIHLNLFCTNSNSIPYEFVPEQWSFLNPTWKFTDKNFNFVTSLSVEGIPVYKNNKVVALSGLTEFYFYDSSSTGNPKNNCPLLLNCVLEVSGATNPLDFANYPYPSYSNNKNVRTAALWYVNDVSPDLLKVTSNYITTIPQTNWQNIKVPFLITAHGDRSYKIPGAQSSISNILFTYPKVNDSLNEQPITVTIPQYNQGDYILDEEPLSFKALDTNNFRTGGYIFTTFTPLQTGNSLYLQVSATVFTDTDYSSEKFPYYGDLTPNSFVVVSNPEQNTLNKITLIPYLNNCTDINYFKNEQILTDGYIKEIPVPAISSTSSFNYFMSGFSGIYSIAIDPRDYSILACDAEADKIYKFSSTGTILSTLQLSSLEGLNSVLSAYTPSSISLDKNYNFWVTLFNTVSVLKFDENFNLLFNKVPDIGLPYNTILDDDFLIKPPVVETDKDNNCWVSYAHPLCSFLVKYDSLGNVLNQIVLQQYAVPVALAVDYYNNIWVANTYNVLSGTGSIQKYDTNDYTLITNITGIPRPGYIAVDEDNNLWFTHSINGLGCHNTFNQHTTFWKLSNANATTIPYLSDFIDNEVFINDENLQGVGVDFYNRVWVVDSFNNKTYVITPSNGTFNTNTDYRPIAIRPNSTVGYFIDPSTGSVFTESNPAYKYRSAQATGDWTGYKWYQKYISFSELSSKNITGTSNTFSIKPLINEYEIRRINESFDTANYLKTLALPEILQNNNILWGSFFPATVGNSQLSSNEDIGQITYERIANFLNNHADIDTCNVDQLQSLAQLVDVPALNYAAELPTEIKRMLDIGSIQRYRLYGIQDLTPILKNSLGNQLNTSSALLTAGTKIILKSKLDNSISLITVPLLSTNLVYPLSNFEGIGFVQPILTNYQFFEFVPEYSNTFIENIIDWTSTFTTLNSTVSTFEQWYGDNGVLEETFNYLLTKNLFLK